MEESYDIQCFMLTDNVSAYTISRGGREWLTNRNIVAHTPQQVVMPFLLGVVVIIKVVEFLGLRRAIDVDGRTRRRSFGRG